MAFWKLFEVCIKIGRIPALLSSQWWNSERENSKYHTVSAPMQPLGCIFQNGFLGEVQFPSKSGLFNNKSAVIFEKTPKTGLFTLPGALFKSGVALARIRYIILNFPALDFLVHKMKFFLLFFTLFFYIPWFDHLQY